MTLTSTTTTTKSSTTTSYPPKSPSPPSLVAENLTKLSLSSPPLEVLTIRSVLLGLQVNHLFDILLTSKRQLQSTLSDLLRISRHSKQLSDTLVDNSHRLHNEIYSQLLYEIRDFTPHRTALTSIENDLTNLQVKATLLRSRLNQAKFKLDTLLKFERENSNPLQSSLNRIPLILYTLIPILLIALLLPSSSPSLSINRFFTATHRHISSFYSNFRDDFTSGSARGSDGPAGISASCGSGSGSSYGTGNRLR